MINLERFQQFATTLEAEFDMLDDWGCQPTLALVFPTQTSDGTDLTLAPIHPQHWLPHGYYPADALEEAKPDNVRKAAGRDDDPVAVLVVYEGTVGDGRDLRLLYLATADAGSIGVVRIRRQEQRSKTYPHGHTHNGTPAALVAFAARLPLRRST
ncbi:hypothetical protein ACQEVF_58260 [Nonomuraea polychroma]|uniref:hypothetical protein n=1 Tax=Nonomuraea polychroma TaxID=46176 RepID=UPI003D93E3C6